MKYVIESLFLDPERRDGLQIWFLADNVTNPTLPNQRRPPRPVSLEELAAIGVEYRYIAIDEQGNYRSVLLCMYTYVNPLLGPPAHYWYFKSKFHSKLIPWSVSRIFKTGHEGVRPGFYIIFYGSDKNMVGPHLTLA